MQDQVSRMHLQPSSGLPRNVAANVVDMLFPPEDSRIPIIAVTGTNGKTTTTRLIAHIAKMKGKKLDTRLLMEYIFRTDC